MGEGHRAAARASRARLRPAAHSTSAGDAVIPMPEDKPVLRIDEIALILGVSRSTAYELARAEAIPVLRLGVRRVVVPTAAFRRWLGLDADTALGPAPECDGFQAPATSEGA